MNVTRLYRLSVCLLFLVVVLGCGRKVPPPPRRTWVTTPYVTVVLSKFPSMAEPGTYQFEAWFKLRTNTTPGGPGTAWTVRFLEVEAEDPDGVVSYISTIGWLDDWPYALDLQWRDDYDAKKWLGRNDPPRWVDTRQRYSSLVEVGIYRAGLIKNLRARAVLWYKHSDGMEEFYESPWTPVQNITIIERPKKQSQAGPGGVMLAVDDLSSDTGWSGMEGIPAQLSVSRVNPTGGAVTNVKVTVRLDTDANYLAQPENLSGTFSFTWSPLSATAPLEGWLGEAYLNTIPSEGSEEAGASLSIGTVPYDDFVMVLATVEYDFEGQRHSVSVSYDVPVWGPAQEEP